MSVQDISLTLINNLKDLLTLNDKILYLKAVDQLLYPESLLFWIVLEI